MNGYQNMRYISANKSTSMTTQDDLLLFFVMSTLKYPYIDTRSNPIRTMLPSIIPPYENMQTEKSATVMAAPIGPMYRVASLPNVRIKSFFPLIELRLWLRKTSMLISIIIALLAQSQALDTERSCAYADVVQAFMNALANDSS